MAQLFKALVEEEDGRYKSAAEAGSFKELKKKLQSFAKEGDEFVVAEFRSTLRPRPPKRITELVLEAEPIRRRGAKVDMADTSPPKKAASKK